MIAAVTIESLPGAGEAAMDSPRVAQVRAEEALVEAGGELTLPPGVQGQLRLLRPEPFLAFAEGRHLVQLLRADAATAPVRRADRIALTGSIESFGIADLFSLVNMSRRSGLLLLATDAVSKTIHFRRGEIVFAASSLPDDRLGQILYRTGKLSREALAEAETHLVPGKRFGAVLLERGLLDANTLWWGIKHQIEEIVFSVFRLTAGSFFFFDGNFLDNELAHFTIDTNNVLMEGYQRLDEWGLIREHIRGHAAVLQPTGKRVKEKLSEQLAQLLALVDGRCTVEEIVRATGWGEFNTTKLLYKLLQAGHVETREGPAAAPAPEDPERARSAALVETYNRAFLLVRDVLGAKAVEVDLARAYQAFLRGASDRTRGILRGLDLAASRRLAVAPLLANAADLLELEAATSRAGDLPAADRRRSLLGAALAEWTAFQVAMVRNLLPAAEARELVSYVRAIEQSAWS
jgi:hypothetical protein